MLIGMRNAMMAGRRLPYDAEVEYLEYTGTQWIDTASQNAVKYEFGISVSNSSADTKIFGNNQAYPGYSALSIYSGKYRGTTIEIIAGSFDSVTIDTTTHLLTVRRDGHTYTASEWFDANPGAQPNTDGGSAIPLIGMVVRPNSIGAINYNGNWIRTWLQTVQQSVRISFFRAYDSVGTPVRDMIPVRKGTFGYFYDRVSGKLFGNAGTGDFVLGPDVVPVEYIESHGTEYIPLDDIHPNYYTYRYTELDYQLTKIERALIQQTGASSLVATLCTGGGYVESVDTGIMADLDPHRIVFDGVTSPYHVSYDGTSIKTFNRSTNSARVFTLFGVDQSGTFVPNCHMKLTRMTIRSAQNGTTEHDYRPVRVGTEGAMMDVLTRRIYRNAGTGAFTYGNDLKYPIPAS